MQDFPGCTPCSSSVQAAGKHGLFHSGREWGQGKKRALTEPASMLWGKNEVVFFGFCEPSFNLLFNYLTISPAQLIQLEVAKILKTQIGEKEVYYFSVLHMAYVHALGIQLLNSLTLCDTP